MNILQQLTSVFQQVFDNPDISLSPDMTANDVEGWDSLSHINLIMAVENSFNIRFKQKEVLGFQNVGDLARSIESKLTA